MRTMNSKKRYTPPTHIRIATRLALPIGISEEIFIGLLFIVIRRIWAHINDKLYTDLEDDILMFSRDQGYYDTLDIVANLTEIIATLSKIEVMAFPIIERPVSDICIDRDGQYIYMRFL